MPRHSLSREEIIENVTRLRIPKDELVVVGGAALKLFDIKDTSDIDVVVTIPQLIKCAEKAKHGYKWGRRTNSLGKVAESEDQVEYSIDEWVDNYTVRQIGTISLMAAPNDRLYSAPFEDLHDTAIEMDGVLVADPQTILAWKLAVNRDKDKSDVAAIQAYLETQAPVGQL